MSSAMALRQVIHIAVLFLLSQMFNSALSQQCTNGGSEASILGWKLQRHIYKTLMADLGLECVLICRRDDRCQSFNWVISLSMCEFSDRTKEARPEDFVPDPDRYYFTRDIKRVPLGSIPELPAETCKEIKASEGQAVSKKYWLSTIKPGIPVLAHCDMNTEDIDECTASPPVCDVNANCTNTRGSYRCTCKSGLSGDGKTCEDIDECNAFPPVCDVNASCTNTRGSYRCTCKSGFSGDGKTCEAAWVTATSSCANLLVLDVSNTSGIIQSGVSPSYSNNMDCHWNLSSNAMLELVFSKFETEASADYVTVYDGDSPSSPLIGTFSGGSLPGPVTSSFNKLHVRFKSNGTGQAFGFRARYRAVTAGSLRIADSTRSTGRVEIFYSNQWGTICDDGWNINAANVVCRQLGFPKASQAFGGARHGPGSGPIWMDDVSCSGSESHIYDCSHRGWGNNDCTHSKDASVECFPIRLADGGVSYGRVEVFYKGIWGTVCDDGWDMKDAQVVCRQLGFRSASSALQSSKYGQGSDPIWMDDVACQGEETSLFNCTHAGWGIEDCSHGEDASVVCNT